MAGASLTDHQAQSLEDYVETSVMLLSISYFLLYSYINGIYTWTVIYF